MACPAIITGDRFLTRTIEHIDCQAQLLGSYGYQALGEPGSVAATTMAGLLTLFVALFGVRLLFGPGPGARDVVYDVLRIGIVLTLAFSWPAFRTVVHDVVLKAPAEIAASIGTPGLPDTGSGFVARLQGVDDAMASLTERGTGRNTGAFIDAEAPGGTFASTALEDESGFAWARVLWLSGVIGTLALMRLLAGLLLALAPLAAALLLFEQTRGLFSGWLRGLVLATIGALGATVVLAVEVAVLEPWLADAVRVRALGYAIPSAPTELVAMTLAFAAVQAGMLYLLSRVAFTRGWPTIPVSAADSAGLAIAGAPRMAGPIEITGQSRAQRISDSVELQLRREDPSWQPRTGYRSLSGPSAQVSPAGRPDDVRQAGGAPRLGSSYRRPALRGSQAATRRDAGA